MTCVCLSGSAVFNLRRWPERLLKAITSRAKCTWDACDSPIWSPIACACDDPECLSAVFNPVEIGHVLRRHFFKSVVRAFECEAAPRQNATSAFNFPGELGDSVRAQKETDAQSTQTSASPFRPRHCERSRACIAASTALPNFRPRAGRPAPGWACADVDEARVHTRRAMWTRCARRRHAERWSYTLRGRLTYIAEQGLLYVKPKRLFQTLRASVPPAVMRARAWAVDGRSRHHCTADGCPITALC